MRNNSFLILFVIFLSSFLIISSSPFLGITSTLLLFALGMVGNIAINVLTNNLSKQNPITNLLYFILNDLFHRWWLYLILFILFLFIKNLPSVVVSQEQDSIDFRTYIVDNSGSMGCKYEGIIGENGYCEDIEGDNYRVDIAKRWVEEDIKNLDLKLERVSLIEIGGKTSIEGDCKVNTIVDIGVKGYDELSRGLEKILPNASGATNLGGAIYKASADILEIQKLSKLESSSEEVVFISDLDDNCLKGKLPIDQIIPKLEQKGYELKNIKNLFHHTKVLQLSITQNKTTKNRNYTSSKLAMTSLLSKNSNVSISSEVSELKKLGINVLKIENYDSFPSLPEENLVKKYFLYFLILVAIFGSTDIVIPNKKIIVIPNKKINEQNQDNLE